MTTTQKKPKAVSKTKQELRRLREFAAFFVAVRPGEDVQTARLRDMALYALTGKRPQTGGTP